MGVSLTPDGTPLASSNRIVGGGGWGNFWNGAFEAVMECISGLTHLFAGDQVKLRTTTLLVLVHIYHGRTLTSLYLIMGPILCILLVY